MISFKTSLTCYI